MMTFYDWCILAAFVIALASVVVVVYLISRDARDSARKVRHPWKRVDENRALARVTWPWRHEPWS